jgi:hypothetical protein
MSTCLYYVDSDVVTNSIKLFTQKLWWRVMNVRHPECVLRSKCSRRSHCIAPMGSNDFLVGF